MAQCRIVGDGGVGRAVSSQRFPRRLATDCALHGASLSLVWPRESNQREGHPDIRVSLRETPLPPVPLRGPAYKGRRGPLSLARHPCLASPYATPALGLLTGTVARLNLRRCSRQIRTGQVTRREGEGRGFGIKWGMPLILALVLLLLTGCAPSYSGWEGLMSSNVGKTFYPQEEFINTQGKRFFAGDNSNKKIDLAEQEGVGTRYHITWKARCKYSILVDGRGIVISWRLENHDLQSCYVF